MATEEQRGALRAVVRGTYDIQKLRIQMGLRVVAQFKHKVLGQEPGQKEEVLDSEAKTILETMRDQYKLITDAVKAFPTPKKFKGNDLISSYTELVLMDEYVKLLKAEERQFRLIANAVDGFDVWHKLLKDIRGCGPAMSGVLISEIDITKARYVSSLWKYAGLDTVSKWILQGTKIERGNLAKPEPTLDLPLELDSIDREEGCTIDGGTITWRGEASQDEPPKRIPEIEGKREPTDTRQLILVGFERDGYKITAAYRMFAFGGRSRRADHLIDVDFIDKDGKNQTRKSITFNPFLKTKLTGVLGPCFIKAGGDYATVYRDYKHRLANHKDHSEKTKGHRHNMAVRYMVKIFLKNIYAPWRELEGCEVHPPYEESKLGMPPHGLGN